MSDTEQSELGPRDERDTMPPPPTLADVLAAAKEASALAVLAKDASDAAVLASNAAAIAAERSANLVIELLQRMTASEAEYRNLEARVTIVEGVLAKHKLT